MSTAPRTPARRSFLAGSLLTACATAVAIGGMVAAAPGMLARPKQKLTVTPNAAGLAGTLNLAGPTDPSNPFFQDLGTNGRLCFTCHDPAAGGSVTPALIAPRFQATDGLDPLFRPLDGAGSPSADVSTPAARQQAYDLLLRRGVIRIGLPLPAGAEFSLEQVADPYGFAGAGELSLFRRPLPAANLPFAVTVMWDGRQTHAGFSVSQNLASQAADATLRHAQATASPSPAVLGQIVQFELGLFHAQVQDARAGALTGAGAKGGPQSLAALPFYPGMNNPFGTDPRGKGFDPRVFQLYEGWAKPPKRGDSAQVAARKAIGRGEVLFNTKPITIRAVGGLNDLLHQPVIHGTCSTCHNVPSIGSFSLDQTLDLGVGSFSPTQPEGLPLYTLRRTATGETRLVTDPGRALITGKWADVSQFKVPALRGLASRPPYFHDGSAPTLEGVVDFYDRRFAIGLTPQEASDLAAFIRAL